MDQIDRAYYEQMSRDELIARLKVAEDALTLIGWCSTDLNAVQDTERGKAAEQMWQQWYGMAKVPDFCDPDRHIELDAMIPLLAATRDRIRGETLRRFGLDDPNA